jgi:DNA-directed RNA polymerase subunit RPC12/RpoP
MKPKIIHTKEFHCDDDHPIVYYVVDENNEGMCEYCSTKFIYKEKKDDKAWVNNVLKGSG